MELSRSEAQTLIEAIVSLKEKKLNIKTSFNLIKNFRMLEEEIKLLEEVRTKLVNDVRECYAERTEDGEFIQEDSVFGVKIKEDKIEEAQKYHGEYVNLLNEKVNIPLYTINIQELEDVDIEMSVIANLEKILTDGD
jgi:hypothetical protein